MMSVPDSLRYYMSTLTGYSRNTVLLNTLNQNRLGTNSAPSLARVSLPVNAIVNMKSISCHAKAKTFGVSRTAGNADAVVALLPTRGIASLIDRCSVSMGGVSLDNSSSNYNLIYASKQNVENSADNYLSDKRVLAVSTLEQPATIDATTFGQEKDLIQNNWLGFTSESEPTFFDTSLVPETFITLQVSDGSPLPVFYEGTTLGAQPAQANPNFSGSECKYELDEIYFTCEVVSIGSGMYSQLQADRIAERGSLDVPYKTYQLFSTELSSAAGSIRGSVSTMSLNKLSAFQRNTVARDNATVPVPVADPWYQQQAPLQCADSMSFAYHGANENFMSSGVKDWEMRVNNAPLPSYRASPLEAFNFAVCANERACDKQKGCLVGSQSMWLNNCWSPVVQLNHNDDVRLASGMDLRSINSQLVFNTSGTGANQTARQVFLLAECQSVVRVGANRAIAVIM